MRILSSIFNFISIHKYFASTARSIAVACPLVPMGLDTPLVVLSQLVLELGRPIRSLYLPYVTVSRENTCHVM